jgi:hypothetical protein
MSSMPPKYAKVAQARRGRRGANPDQRALVDRFADRGGRGLKPCGNQDRAEAKSAIIAADV